MSLYKPEKGPDFRFIDRVINEQFQVGGVDIFIHKYLGPVAPGEGEATPSTPDNSMNPIPELGIQDVLFMENRDRNYEPDVYSVRGIYTMSDLDFNLSQFGLFLQNDTILMHFHLRNCVDTLGRKIMPGDVLELPHLKDEYALDNHYVALKRFYVVQDVSRPSNGFSQTWYPHLVRAKCTPLIDSQEFSQIFAQDSGNGDRSTLKDLLSTYNQSILINDQIITQASVDAPLSGYDTSQFFVIPVSTGTGLVQVTDASDAIDDTSIDVLDASVVLSTPNGQVYVGYASGGIPNNASAFGSGIQFPTNPPKGQYFLRTDYLPNVLYKFDGGKWIMTEQNVRMTMNQFGAQDVSTGTFYGSQIRQTQKTSFINNTTTATINGRVVVEKQALNSVLLPKADN